MLIQRGVDEDLEKPWLMSIAPRCALSYSLPYEEPTTLQFHVDSMITPRKLIKIARKWQKLPATRRKGMSFPRSFGYGDAVVCSSRPSMAEKGHFVVYSADGKRFVLPLAYLKNKIIGQLFRLAEEEFGMHSNGPLTLPCVANYLESVQEMVVELVIRWVIEISDKPGEEEPEPAFEFIGNFHGDKPVGRELLLRLANWICDNYAKDSLARLIVENIHLHILPSMNPDGYFSRRRGNANNID
ncbi:hypothetical protein NC652_005672 [Populus alba x Populus x berolinensis]|nr:hypothetical protein NC652_005672 [Populus alba x Populus x berolinensis]